MTSRWSLTCYTHTGNIVRPSPLKMALSYVEQPSSSPHQKGRGCYNSSTSSIKDITKAQFVHGCVFQPGINKAIEEAVQPCESCTQFQAQNTAAPLTPMPTPSHPWQMCTTDTFTLEGVDYLICGNLYSKMILIRCLPSGQRNTVKVVSLLKEMFLGHGIPKVLHFDNGPQYVSAQFTEFCTSRGITHKTSSPHYPQSKGFAEACVKSMKHALQHAKYSSANPQLAFWCSELHPLMPSSHHLLSSCTNTRL